MKSFKDFVASRVSGTEEDPLLAKHPNNPALMLSNSPYFGELPVRQFLYDGGNGNFYLISKQTKHNSTDTVYAYEWTHPADSVAKSLAEAELLLWEEIRLNEKPSINETEFTREQVNAIYDRWTMRGNTEGHMSFVDFIATAKPVFKDKAVTIPWCGMHLCIESDGYTHS